MKGNIRMYLILFFIIWVLFFFVSYYTVYYELGNLGTCLIIINFILYWYFGIKIIYMITIPESYRPILVLLVPIMVCLMFTPKIHSCKLALRDISEQKKIWDIM